MFSNFCTDTIDNHQSTATQRYEMIFIRPLCVASFFPIYFTNITHILYESHRSGDSNLNYFIAQINVIHSLEELINSLQHDGLLKGNGLSVGSFIISKERLITDRTTIWEAGGKSNQTPHPFLDGDDVRTRSCGPYHSKTKYWEKQIGSGRANSAAPQAIDSWSK